MSKFERKVAEQNTNINQAICTNWIFVKLLIEKSFIQKYLESNNLSATNVTFVTKDEIEHTY